MTTSPNTSNIELLRAASPDEVEIWELDDLLDVLDEEW